MSAHVLLNLRNELGKRDQMRGLPSILSLFRNELNKFNNTGAQMLDSIYHMTLKFLRSHFWHETHGFAIFYATLKWTSLCNVTKSVNHQWFIGFIARRYLTPRHDVM